MDKMRILLVDDICSERLYLSFQLQKLGHSIKSVDSAQEALSCYADFDPDLLLLDINMPDMNGIELAQQIRDVFPDWVPIIFLSGNDNPEIIANAVENGGDDYLIKPVNPLVLSAKLRAMQRISSMRHQLKEATLQLQQANEKLSQLVNEDGLTKLANRRFLDHKVREFIALHGRVAQPFTIIMLDVDHFKRYNDFYGHIQGDNCLKLLSDEFKSKFSRAGELCARYGGEEFVILVSNCDLERARKECERLKESIEALAIPHENSPTSDILTISQGAIAFLPTGFENAESLYLLVDELLYKAKVNGRNQYQVEACFNQNANHNKN